MNTIYTDHTYRFRHHSGTSRRSLFWNKVADFLLCVVSTMGVIAILIFLLML